MNRRGRPPKDENHKVKEVSFYATPWIYKALNFIIAEEKAKGSKLSRSEMVRRIVQLGIDRYRELGELPRRERE